MKKWFTILLLLITLTATFYPCCSQDDCDSHTLGSQSSNDNSNEKGSCSPFITCGTCTGFAYTVSSVELPVIIQEKTVHYPQSPAFLVHTYTASLLQPPRA